MSTAGDVSRETSKEAGRKAGGKALIAIAVFLLALALLNVLFPAEAYLFIKAFHVVSIIAWMAGLLYLPRLFVYHSDVATSEMGETFSVMEGRLLKVIMTPAMLVSWVLGLWLGATGGWFAAGFAASWWLYAKIVLVLGLTAAHMHFAASARRFGDGTQTKPARYWRMMNEVPTLLMIAIILLVIVAKDW